MQKIIKLNNKIEIDISKSYDEIINDLKKNFTLGYYDTGVALNTTPTTWIRFGLFNKIYEIETSNEKHGREPNQPTFIKQYQNKWYDPLLINGLAMATLFITTITLIGMFLR